MAEIKTTTYPIEHLTEFCERVFASYGVSEEDARQAADVLALADLRGIDSHGIARLKLYCEWLDSGNVNPRPDVRIVRESPSTATVDGDNGLGLVVGPRANAIAMHKAEQAGSGWVAVRNTQHFGIAGYYVLQAVERDQIGWAMTNTTSIVAPLWGAERRLGTNPIAVAFGGLQEPPIVIDMATTAATFGRIEIAMRKQEPLLEGWAIDSEGRPTTDPQAMVDGGSLLPIGGDRDHGGHKGYCLAALVDLLCGPLSGASWGPFTPDFTLAYEHPDRRVGDGIGHFFGAMRVDGFIDPDEFKRQIDDWIRTMRSTKPVPGTSGPLIPGDPEREAETRRRKSGVPLLQPVVEDLRIVAGQTGIPFD